MLAQLDFLKDKLTYPAHDSDVSNPQLYMQQWQARGASISFLLTHLVLHALAVPAHVLGVAEAPATLTLPVPAAHLTLIVPLAHAQG